MNVRQKFCNFIFHPLAKNRTDKEKALAVLTVIALSILSFGTFLIAFIANQWKNRKVTIQNSPTKETEIAGKVLKEEKRDPPPLKATFYTPPQTAAQIKAATVKNKHAEQLKQFEVWAKKNDWKKFHDSHYDWWMFPISRSSTGQGSMYAVYQKEIEILKQDKEFMENYLRGVELVACAWGWDVKNGKPVLNPLPSQKWANWPVRLGKMADSLRLFDQEEYHKSMKLYAIGRTPWSTFDRWVKEKLEIC